MVSRSSRRADAIFEIDNLHHTYPGAQGVTALRGITLRIAEGEYVAVVGANGSGKSTLARHLNALLLPSVGTVRVLRLDTADAANARAIRQAVQMVFQQPDSQIVATIVEEDVAFGPENFGVPWEELSERVRTSLQTVGMWGERGRPPHMLSGGQKQRVAIAGALAVQPRALVLDEATAMLDPAGRAAVLDVLAALHARGTTIITITHEMDEAAEAERIVVLDRGKVALDGPPREVFADAARVRDLGLDVPPVTELALRLGLPPALDAEELLRAVEAGLGRLPRAGPHPERSPEGAESKDASTFPTPESERSFEHKWMHPDRETEQLQHEPEHLDREPEHPERSGAESREAAPPRPPVVLVEDLEHIYLRGTPFASRALRGVTLTVERGDAVALIGQTGSGKSTLMQHLNGLLRVHGGRVVVDGHDLGHPDVDVRAVRQTVGLLFQQPEDQLFERYVGDDVAFGPRQMGFSREEVRERVRAAMDAVGLPFEAFKDRETRTLSGGEQRRAALAGVLALRPRVLVADEPTAGLDPQGRRAILAIFRRLNGDGVTLVLSSHRIGDIAALCRSAVALRDGRVAAAGPLREVLTAPEHLAAHGMPAPALALVAERLREMGWAVPAGALLPEEIAEAVWGNAGAHPATTALRASAQDASPEDAASERGALRGDAASRRDALDVDVTGG